MIDLSPPPPSRKLHLVARVARWTLGLVLAFWLVLVGVWGALHGFIVPRIGEWRGQVERLATQALGAPVRIDALTAHSEGLFPTIELSGVSILDPQQRQALKLQRVVLTVSARSVLRLGLEQLYIDAPELDVRRLQDGRWQVAGLDVVSSDATQDNRALEWLLEQPELVIQRGVVQFTDEQQSPETTQWRDVEVVVRNRHWHHVLRMDATPVAGEGERMQVVGEFRQPLLPSSLPPWQRWNGQWYAALQMRQVPALPWPRPGASRRSRPAARCASGWMWPAGNRWACRPTWPCPRPRSSGATARYRPCSCSSCTAGCRPTGRSRPGGCPARISALSRWMASTGPAATGRCAPRGLRHNRAPRCPWTMPTSPWPRRWSRPCRCRPRCWPLCSAGSPKAPCGNCSWNGPRPPTTRRVDVSAAWWSSRSRPSTGPDCPGSRA